MTNNSTSTPVPVILGGIAALVVAVFVGLTITGGGDLPDVPDPFEEEDRFYEVTFEVEWSAPEDFPDQPLRTQTISYQAYDDADTIPDVLISPWEHITLGRLGTTLTLTAVQSDYGPVWCYIFIDESLVADRASNEAGGCRVQYTI